VSRFADTVRHVAEGVERELAARPATTGAER